MRPGSPSWLRPTGAPQDAQKRFSSATSAFLRTTLRGSGTGAAGTEVMPAPRCWVRVRFVTNRRVGRVPPARAEPSGVDPSRALVLSQVVLSFGIPFALVPLVRLTSRRELMGDDPLVLTVGALDDKDTVTPSDDAVPAFSSQGPTAWDGWWKPDLIAPGKSVVSVTSTTSVIWNANRSARVGTKNFVGSGTSFAAAITSGAAAIVLHANPLATPDNVKAALLTTTNAGPSPPQSPFVQGHGVLDVSRAVSEPLVSITQDVSSIVPPTVLGVPIPKLSRQVVSTWATVVPLEQALYPQPYPFPYSGPATTSLDGASPLFQSSAWNSSAWNSSAWNSSAWNSSAWNSSAWNSSAWNSSAWNSSAWN